MRCISLLLVSSLALTTTARAAMLFTPTLWPVAPDALACNLTNVGQKTRTVKVRIISNGVVLLDSGELVLEPQHTADHVIEGFPDGGPIYCEFTVQGKKNQYRGVAKLFHLPNSSDFVAVPAR